MQRIYLYLNSDEIFDFLFNTFLQNELQGKFEEFGVIAISLIFLFLLITIVIYAFVKVVKEQKKKKNIVLLAILPLLFNLLFFKTSFDLFSAKKEYELYRRVIMSSKEEKISFLMKQYNLKIHALIDYSRSGFELYFPYKQNEEKFDLEKEKALPIESFVQAVNDKIKLQYEEVGKVILKSLPVEKREQFVKLWQEIEHVDDFSLDERHDLKEDAVELEKAFPKQEKVKKLNHFLNSL